MGRKAPGHHAPGVRPVAGVGEPGEDLAFIEKRLHELHVHEVRAAEVGVIHDEDVTRIDRPLVVPHALDHRPGGKLHRADKNGQAELALGDQRAVFLGVDAVGAVHRLRDHGREGCAAEGEVHLVADLLQAVLDHGKRDGIDCYLGHGSPSLLGPTPGRA